MKPDLVVTNTSKHTQSDTYIAVYPFDGSLKLGGRIYDFKCYVRVSDCANLDEKIRNLLKGIETAGRTD